MPEYNTLNPNRRTTYDTVNDLRIPRGVSLGTEVSQQLVSDPLDAGARYYQDLNYRRGELQSGWAQLGNAAAQSLAEVIGGTIESIGYLGDFSAFSQDVMEGEQAFGNALSDFGRSIKEKTRTNFPIYSNAQGFAPGDWSWWMSNAPSITSTFSMMIPSGAAVGIIGAASKAAGLTAKMSRGLTKGIGILGQAGMSRHMENMMEATDTYNSLLDENLRKGLSVGDSRKNASIAASSIYNKNWAMYAQDVVQYAMLAGGLKGILGKVDDSVGMAKATGKAVQPVLAKKALSGLGNMAGEGIEEGYQFIVQKEGEYIAQRALDPNIESNFSERLGEYVKDGEMWTASFFGALGAGVMQGTMKGVNRALTKGPNLDKLRIEDVKSWGAEAARGIKTGLVAAEIGNANISNTNRDTVVSNMVMKSASLNQTDKLKEFAETMANPTDEDLQTYGVSKEDAQTISENSQELLNDINRFEEIHANNMKKFNNRKLKSLQHALLASRNEWLLEKTNNRVNESNARISEIETNMVNFFDLSAAGQEMYALEAKKSALQRFNKGLNKEISDNKKLTGRQTSTYENLVKQNDKAIEKYDTRINELKETRTEEEAKNDADTDITSAALDEFQKEQDNLEVLKASVKDLQTSIEKLNKGEMPYKTEPLYKSMDEVNTVNEIPERNDFVKYTDPETKKEVLAQVNKIENESDYTIQPLTLEEGAVLGDPIKVSVENLELVVDINNKDRNVESDETDTTKPTTEEDDITGFGYFIESLSYVDTATGVRNTKLDEVISNPNTNYDNAYFTFEIDKNYKKFWDSNENLVKEINKGPLSQDRINNLNDYLINNIPIKVLVTIDGTTYSKGTYLYTGEANVIRAPKVIELEGKEAVAKFEAQQRAKAKQVRFNILNKLLKGEKAKATSINPSKGSHNNTESSKNIAEQFNQPASEIRLAIGDRDGVLTEGDGIDYPPAIQVPKGKVFAVTEKTCNGDQALVKLNNTKLSEEHADILFEALFQMYQRTDGGYKGEFKDTRVEGLSTGQVIDMLSYNGERQTSTDHAENKERLGEFMKNKQLYVKKDDNGTLQLHFGTNVVPFLSVKDDAKIANKKAFVEWATTYKNYPVRISNDRLGLTGINTKFEKTFKLGSLVHDGTTSYANMLISNNMLTTDVAEFVPGSLFHRPVLKFDSASLESEVKETKQETKVVTKEESKVIKEAQQNDDVFAVKENKDLANIPEGAEIYVERIMFDENGDQQLSNWMIGTVVKNKKGNTEFRIKDSLATQEPYSLVNGIEMSSPALLKVFENELGIFVDSIRTSIKATENQTNDVKETEEVVGTDNVSDEIADIERRREEELNEASIKDTTISLVEIDREYITIRDNDSEWLFFNKKADEIGQGSITQESNPKLYNELVEAGVKPFQGIIGRSEVFDAQKKREKVLKAEQKKSIKDRNLKVITNEVRNENSLKLVEINAKYDAELEALKETKEEVKPTPSADPNNIKFEDDDIFRQASAKPTYEIQNLSKELQKVKKMLGKRVSGDFQQVDKLIDIVNTGRKAFANYRHDVITIYNQSEVGTAYHEAFHRVSLAYLTPQEREAVYESARREYSLRGISDREVEETLAEKFREYMLSRRKATFAEKIQRFFERLWNNIYSFFTGPHRLTSYEVDNLFQSIYMGKYKQSTLLKENANNLVHDYNRSVYGTEFNSIESMETLRSIVKGLTYELFKVNNGLDFENLDKVKPKFGPLIKQIELLIDNHKASLELDGLTQEQKDLHRSRISLFTDLLGFNEATGQYESFSTLKELIFDLLQSMDLNVNRLKDNQPDNFNDITENLSIDEFDRQSFEMSPKQNAQANIKMLIGFLPNVTVEQEGDQLTVKNSRNPVTNMVEFVDYNQTWDTLLADLYEYNNIDDMVTRLQELAEIRPHYYTLVNRLRKNKNGILQAQFEATMRKHRNAFVNAIFNVGKESLEVIFTDADVKKVATNKRQEWNLAFHVSNKVVTVDGVSRVDSAFKDTLSDKYKKLSDKVRLASNLPNFGNLTTAYYPEIISLLSDISINIDDLTIDQAIQLGNKSNEENFTNFVLRDLNNIVKNVIVNHNPDSKHTSVMFNDNAVTKIANLYAKAHPEQMSNMVLGPSSAQYYTFSNHSTVTSLIRDFKHDPDLAAKLLDYRFNEDSRFLNQIATSKDTRDKMRVLTFAGIFSDRGGDEGRDYYAMNHVEDYLVKLHANHRGLVNFPTLSDKKTYYFLEGLETIPVSFKIGANGAYKLSDETTNELFKQVQSEYDRITKAREDRDLLMQFRKDGNEEEAATLEANMIENYHHVKGDYTKGNAYNFVAFNGLSYEKFSEDDVKEQLPVAIANLVKKEMEYARELGIIEKDEDGAWSSKRIDKKVLNKLTEDYGSTSAAIGVLFTEHVVKNIDNQLELHKMFIGDPAFYKADKNTGSVEVDLGKRLGELIASGEEMKLHVKNFGEDLTKMDFNVSTLQSQPLKSAYYDDLFKIYSERIGEKAAKRLLKPYTELEQADGQTFITPAMYRSISIRIGEWSPKKQSAYDLLVSDRELTLGEENKAMEIVLNPLKTVYFGYDFFNDIAIPTYDKMSMAPLFRRAVSGTQIETLLDRMEGVGEYAGQEKIDMVKMDSATKVGNRGAKPFFDDKYQSKLSDLSKLSMHKQQFKNLRRQTVVPTHEQERTNIGTQFLKIAMSNLNMKAPVYKLNGEKTGEQIARIINGALTALAKQGKEKLDAMFGVKDNKVNKEDLTETIRKEAKKANMPMSVIETLRTSDGDFYQSPDAMPNRKWFESRFIGLITKEVIDRKLPGGQFVQVSNLGFRKIKAEKTLESESDRITWLRNDTTDLPFVHKVDGELQSMGCAVSISLFKHSIPNYDKLTHKQRVKFVVDNNLDVLGYRIPTQGQNSTVVMRVMGVLPDQSGDSIILPSEFVGLTGSDFDIDKLFLVRKNFNFNKDGEVKEVKFITNDDERAYQNMMMHKFSMYRTRLSDSFYNEYYGKKFDTIEKINALDTASNERDILLERIESLKLLRESVQNKSGYNRQINDLYAQIDQLKEDYNLSGVYSFRDLKRNEKKELNEMIKKELVKQGFLPKFDEFKKLDDFSKNIPAAIENLLFDAYRSVLTSDEHLLNTTAPLGGLTDQLKELANTVRELYQEDDNSIMSMFTPRAQSKSKFKYASGKAGIGPFALHNSHHVLTQIADYAMTGGVSELQNYKEVESKVGAVQLRVLDLAAKTGDDKVNILDWLSALIDSHVDLAKDPYIMDLNINPFTYDISGYLIRTGVGVQTFKLLSMEGIKMASDKFLATRESIFNRNGWSTNRVLKDTQRKLLAKVGAESMDDVQEAIDERMSNFLTGKDDSIENKMFGKDGINRNRDYWLDQLAALEYFSIIKDEAAILTQDVQSTQIDSRKYGSSLMEIEAFMSKIIQSDINSKDSKTYGYEKLIPYDPIDLYTPEKEGETFIAGYYRHGLAHMLELYSDVTMSSTKTFRDSIYEILALNGKTRPSSKDLVTTANELYSALLGKYFFANPDEMNLNPGNIRALLFGKNNIFARFNKLKTKYPELFENNKFLIRLDTIFDESSKVQNYFAHKNSSFKDSFETDDVIYAWEDLLKHSDPEIEKLARHLFTYSYYTTGFNNKINGFNTLIPPSMMKMLNIGERTASMDGVVKGLLKKLINDQSKEELRDVLDDVLSHQHYDTNANYRIEVSGEEIGNDTIYTLDDPQLAFLGFNKSKKPIYLPYLKRKDRLYKLRGVVTSFGGNVPIYTAADRKGIKERGRFIHQYGFKDDYILSTNLEPKKVETITEELSSKLSQHFHGTFVELTMDDIYYSKLQDMMEEVVTPEKTLDILSEDVNAELSSFVNHSGGAIGADTKWDEIGSEYGMVNNKHYYYGEKTPNGNVEITKAQLDEGWAHVLKANETLKRKPGNYKNLLSRNWMQVKNADTVFAIGRVSSNNKQVDGGTGWAVQMAIDSKTPVYVFDQNTNEWVKASWLGDGTFFGFEEVEGTPRLTKNFAGIGSRSITEEGIQAIRDVYKVTNNSTEVNVKQPSEKLQKLGEQLSLFEKTEEEQGAEIAKYCKNK